MPTILICSIDEKSLIKTKNIVLEKIILLREGQLPYSLATEEDYLSLMKYLFQLDLHKLYIEDLNILAKYQSIPGIIEILSAARKATEFVCLEDKNLKAYNDELWPSIRNSILNNLEDSGYIKDIKFQVIKQQVIEILINEEKSTQQYSPTGHNSIKRSFLSEIIRSVKALELDSIIPDDVRNYLSKADKPDLNDFVKYFPKNHTRENVEMSITQKLAAMKLHHSSDANTSDISPRATSPGSSKQNYSGNTSMDSEYSSEIEYLKKYYSTLEKDEILSAVMFLTRAFLRSKVRLYTPPSPHKSTIPSPHESTIPSPHESTIPSPHESTINHLNDTLELIKDYIDKVTTDELKKSKIQEIVAQLKTCDKFPEYRCIIFFLEDNYLMKGILPTDSSKIFSFLGCVNNSILNEREKNEYLVYCIKETFNKLLNHASQSTDFRSDKVQELIRKNIGFLKNYSIGELLPDTHKTDLIKFNFIPSIRYLVEKNKLPSAFSPRRKEINQLGDVLDHCRSHGNNINRPVDPTEEDELNYNEDRYERDFFRKKLKLQARLNLRSLLWTHNFCCSFLSAQDTSLFLEAVNSVMGVIDKLCQSGVVMSHDALIISRNIGNSLMPELDELYMLIEGAGVIKDSISSTRRGSGPCDSSSSSKGSSRCVSPLGYLRSLKTK